MQDRTKLGSEVRVRQLEAFQAVAQTGSYTRAAQLLGISQPAVSRLVRALGDSTGLELFAREGGRSVPTPEARLLLNEAGRVLETLAGFEQLHRDLSDQRAGQLRVACLPGFATTHLPQVLARFMESRPQIHVTVEPDRPDRILDWIVSEACEVGLTADFPGHPVVSSRRVPVRAVCILPPGHPLARFRELDPVRLRNERLIHSSRQEPFCTALLGAFEDCGVQPRSVVEVRQFGSACKLVSEGMGVSVVSELDAIEFAYTGIELRPFSPGLTHNLDILHSRLSTSSMLALEFIETFLESLSPFRVDIP